MAPITACTDILKKGGYIRFTNYLENLKTEMDKLQVNTLNDFIFRYADTNQNEPVPKAAKINTENLIKQIDSDPHYTWKENNKNPKTIESKLKLFDCINCDICIPVCPNTANFSFKVDTATEHYSDYFYKNGTFVPENEQIYILEKNQQIGNIAEFCNDCGNCETFCPEVGAPYKIKPRFYIKYEDLNSIDTLNGFHFKSPYSILAKINGIIIELEYNFDQSLYIWETGQITMHFSEKNALIRYNINADIEEGIIIKLEPYIISKIILKNYIKHRDYFPSYL